MRHWPFCVRKRQRGDSETEVLGTGCDFIFILDGGGVYPPGEFVRADSKGFSGEVSVRADSKGVRCGARRAGAHTWSDRAETKGVRTNHGSVGGGGGVTKG